jgi:hypothetical protein
MILIIPLLILMIVLAWILRPKEKLAASQLLSTYSVIILSVVLALAAIVVQLLSNRSGNIEVSAISNTLFVINLGLVGATILVLLLFSLLRKWNRVKQIGFGICIAVLICIVELGLLEWLGGV